MFFACEVMMVSVRAQDIGQYSLIFFFFEFTRATTNTWIRKNKKRTFGPIYLELVWIISIVVVFVVVIGRGLRHRRLPSSSSSKLLLSSNIIYHFFLFIYLPIELVFYPGAGVEDSHHVDGRCLFILFRFEFLSLSDSSSSSSFLFSYSNLEM